MSYKYKPWSGDDGNKGERIQDKEGEMPKNE